MFDSAMMVSKQAQQSELITNKLNSMIVCVAFDDTLPVEFRCAERGEWLQEKRQQVHLAT